MNKSLNNVEIAELLRDVAAAYQLDNEAKNKFKIIAYQRAADAVEHASSELKDLWDDNKLDSVPGIGPSIALHLSDLFKHGRSKHFEDLLKPLPKAMFKLMQVPGIGPKRAYRLSSEFKLSEKNAIEELKKIAQNDKISKLEGFGSDSQDEILKALMEYKGPATRHLLPYAEEIATNIIKWMKREASVKAVDPLGSLRRRASTIGDIDIAAASTDSKKTIEHFIKYPHKSRIIEQGDRSAAILLPGNVHVDLLVHNPATYGATLQHFTGSKHHNVALREYAIKQGLSLSDYGIKAMKKPQQNKFKGLKIDPETGFYQIPTEEKFYSLLGMEWIPPEMREGNGEIEAAINNQIPKLVEISDIKADLQIHSDFDIETSHDVGESSMQEIIRKADSLGYEYLAFTEHNPSRGRHTDKQIVDILKRKQEYIEKINYSIKKENLKRVKKVFNSLEIDIMNDGKLPVPQLGLETLDFALVSIHSQFRLDKKLQTQRVLDALSYPKIKIFAHPTGRKLNAREGADLDWSKIFEQVLKNNQWVEINCDPMRLDLPDILVKDAVKLGVKLTLGTDAHHKNGLDNMRFGISVARRGWATKNAIINTRSIEEFEKLL